MSVVGYGEWMPYRAIQFPSVLPFETNEKVIKNQCPFETMHITNI